MSVSDALLKQILEAALLASGKPLAVTDLRDLFEPRLSARRIKQTLVELEQDYQPRGINLVRVGSGYRFQTNVATAPWVSLLWQERAPRYTRATLETLALIAYRQPITRGEIEAVRGVAVSSQIVRTLLDRGWIRTLGYKEVPGRPALYGTTKTFLDYFGLASLGQLPPLEQFTEFLDAEASDDDEPAADDRLKGPHQTTTPALSSDAGDASPSGERNDE